MDGDIGKPGILSLCEAKERHDWATEQINLDSTKSLATDSFELWLHSVISLDFILFSPPVTERDVRTLVNEHYRYRQKEI